VLAVDLLQLVHRAREEPFAFRLAVKPIASSAAIYELGHCHRVGANKKRPLAATDVWTENEV
jgi:hypothetical protein